MHRFICFLFLFVFSQSIYSQKLSASDDSTFELGSIIFKKSKPNSIIGNVPGSTASLSKIDLKLIAPLSANEMFRKFAGVHVVDEEGVGMRINIGIRGLDPDRSRGVLVLEDGIPVSLNPYGEPELYYSPVIDRMSGLEVMKGSGQIIYGPQTIGGVVNYLTSGMPDKNELKVKISAGSGALANLLINHSARINNNVGINTSIMRKRADQLGYVSFGITDFNTKLFLKLNKKADLIYKLGVYDEVSNSTYIGLTQTMFNQGNQDFTLMSPTDLLKIRRYSSSLTHLYRFSKKTSLQSNVYAYTTSRNWQRQDFSSTKSTSNQTGVIWGDTSVENGAIYMRNQNAHRDRQFQVFGMESKLNHEYLFLERASEVKVGVRYLAEKAFEQRKNGRKYDAKSGDLVEDEIRTGNAISAFVHNQISLTSKIIFTAGVRLENYDYNRNILRNTFRVNNVNRIVDTNLIAGNSIMTIIPGAGLNFNIKPNNTIFAGVHKGFAPPRLKDAITAQGVVYQLDAEESWNYEVGTRGTFKQFLTYELTGFYMQFENQIIPVSESSGGTGSGLVNGGQTIHQGIEASYKLNILNMLRSKSRSKLHFQNNLSFVKAYYNNDRYINSGSEQINIKDNYTPYAPKYFHTASLNYELPMGLGFVANASFTGEQFGDELNSIVPSNDGREGMIDAFKVFDANVYYKIKKINAQLTGSVKNLTNERYIASRRPQGIRVGLPRIAVVTFEMTF
jgi:Fe(3+) dicitrate transport protein